MMLVPDVRNASPEAAAKAVAACQRMSRRDARRYLYEEFTLDDRRDLDDATLEMLGVEDPDERAELRDRLYRDVTDLQQAIREREIIAQRDRRRSSQRAASRPQDVADGAVGRARVRPRSAPVPGGVRHPPQRRGAHRSAVRGGGGGHRAHRPRGSAEGGHGPGRKDGTARSWTRGASPRAASWRPCRYATGRAGSGCPAAASATTPSAASTSTARSCETAAPNLPNRGHPTSAGSGP